MTNFRLPDFKRPYQSPIRATEGSYQQNTITFTGQYFKHGDISSPYVPRAVDAHDYMNYRREYYLSSKLGEYRAQALTKEQKQKAGGLLAVNIPLKSKAIESLFGEGGAGLKVSGSHMITFSGRSQWDDRTSTATFRQNKFPSLNMEQVSRFDINGTIGSKISVSVSQDSKTDIPLANRIIIRYKGDEDDIIKTIEAGNTTLSLPNTQFVGYSSRIQGLFGIKTQAQVGGLNLTAIASQEKGTTERNSITATGSSNKTYVRDYQYADGRIFDLGLPSEFKKGDVITNLRVFKVVITYGNDNTAKLKANFWVDPSDTANPAYTSESGYSENVQELNRDEFDQYRPYYAVIFEAANGGSQGMIGVYMVVKHSNGDSTIYGDISKLPYSLKLIKSASPYYGQKTWKYLWRNVYYLNSTNIDVSGLDIKVFKGGSSTEGDNSNLDNQNGTPYIQILGLDQTGPSNTGDKDNRTDVDNTNLVDPMRGLLIFPSRNPFNDTIGFGGKTLDEKVPEIDSLGSSYLDIVSHSKYYIEVSNRSRLTEISLGRPNIIEGSERITVNGVALVKGEDYDIQYDFGQIRFLKEDAIDPNSNINIEYEYTPFISAEKKSLFGIRGEYEVNNNLKLGSTYLYKSDKATDRKPKIGQETSRATVLDADGTFKMQPNFLSKVVNLLPLYSTNANSNLMISGEVAKSYPNPNVDGVAYLDDFEGTRDSYSLGVLRSTWTASSKPAVLDTATRYRGNIIWFNPYDLIATREIWNREVSAQESGTQTLSLVFNPGRVDKRWGETPDSAAVSQGPDSAWAGIMRYLPLGSANQDPTQLLELRVRGYEGILHIDLGRISEDVNGNGADDEEDIPSAGGYRNRLYDPGEDVGLDGKVDSAETGYNALTNPDPNGDDWNYTNKYDYSHINGTEGNKEDADRTRPDGEDISGNGGIDKENSYFSYKIDLSSRDFYVEGSDFHQWRTFRIPLKDSASVDTVVGTPIWSQINYARLWVESPRGDSIEINIAALDLIQSLWRDTLKTAVPNEVTTSEFKAAVANTQENIDYYPPPGVTGFYDKNKGITEPEQSLALHYENLVNGDTGIARKILFDTPNLMGYRTLKMFVHGDTGTVHQNILFFFRVGPDSLNYYEFHTVLEPGWSEKNNVVIDFNAITGIKEYLNKSRASSQSNLPYDTTVGNYRIFGQPNITKIKYLACGVVNLDTTQAVTGDVWVDELRLDNVRRDVGTAARVTASGNLADLLSYSAGVNFQNSYFRQISSSTRGGSADNLGSGHSVTSYNFGINFGIDKFLPRALNASIPVSLTYSKSTDVPLLRFGSDIILPTELRDSESSVGISRSLSVSESMNLKTRNPFFSLLLNRIRSNFSYNRSQGRSPAAPYSFNENYHVGSRYELTFTNVPGIKPFFWTKPIPLLNKLSGNHFYLLPNTFSTSGDFNRTLSLSENSSKYKSSSFRRDFRYDMRLSYKISENLNFNYNLDSKRDMTDPNTVRLKLSDLHLGKETNYSENFGASYAPNLFPFFTHRFNFSTAYREDLNIIDNTLNIGATKSYGISGDFSIGKMFPGNKGNADARVVTRRGVTKVEKKKNILDQIFAPINTIMHMLTGWINPITYEYNQRYNYSYTGLKSRATWKFRFGITESVGAPIDSSSTTQGRSTFTSKNTGISLGTGFDFLGGIRTDISYSKKINKDIIKPISPQKDIQTSFPDIRFSIRPLKTFKLLNPLIRRFNPRTGYSKSRSETINLQTGFKVVDRTSTTQRPLLSFSFDLLNGLSVAVNSDKAVTEEKYYNSDNGRVTTKKRDRTTNQSISAKYSFSAPTGIKIPFLGRMKFNSTMSISVDINFRKQRLESAIEDNPLASSGERTDFSVIPNISYTFSSQIRGGISGRWQDTNDISQQTKTHAREVRIWVDIRF
ncbi:conserved hypothetical protein [Candidatus Zixiibacteriota bacterium]|nr:conserved hypothetical protein [candidate division Zixibacteria bacterium]